MTYLLDTNVFAALSRRRTELERVMTEVVAGARVLPYGERAARWHAVERGELVGVRP